MKQYVEHALDANYLYTHNHYTRYDMVELNPTFSVKARA